MDFKTRFQGRTSTIDKNGVIGIINQSTSQPIKKQLDSQCLKLNTNTELIAQSYYFQKFKKNAEAILQQPTDIETTLSSPSGYPSYRFLYDLQKINSDQYQIIAIPKKAYDNDKSLLTHSNVPLFKNTSNKNPIQNTSISQLNIKNNPHDGFIHKFKNLNLNHNKNLFISAGYGALNQKKLNFLTDRKMNTQLK